MIAVIQPMLRHNHSDSFAQEKSHIYGRSTSNQVTNKIAIIMELVYIYLTLENRSMVVSTQKTAHRMVDNILQSELYSYNINTAPVQITLLVYTYYTYMNFMQDLQIEGFFSSGLPHHV